MTRLSPRLKLVTTAGVTAVLALSGCGSGGDGAVPATATGSLEHLASEANCEPDVQTDADEIRQAICGNGAGRFVLATFATDRGQQEWLDGAKDYGGHYLVGPRWVVVGRTEMVTALRSRLGGTLEDGESHGSAAHPGHGG